MATWCRRDTTPHSPLTAAERAVLSSITTEWALPAFVSPSHYKEVFAELGTWTGGGLRVCVRRVGCVCVGCVGCMCVGCVGYVCGVCVCVLCVSCSCRVGAMHYSVRRAEYCAPYLACGGEATR